MRICTWNSQGYKFGDNTINTLIKQYQIDILCLQECGQLGNIKKFVKCANIKIGEWYCDTKTIFNVLYYELRCGQAGCRCNMAILVRDTITIYNPVCLEVVTKYDASKSQEEPTENDTGSNNDRKGLRGMLHTEIAVGNSRYRIANVHLPSGVPSFARKIGHTFLNMPFMQWGKVIMVGDFNTSPESWNFNNKVHNLVIANNDYTYPSLSKNLDYMVTTMNPSSIYAKVVSAPFSDHLPVVFFCSN